MIQPVVEGQGEEAAFPILLQRLIHEFDCYAEIGSPVRSKRTQMVREEEFKRAVRLASYKPKACAIFVLLDADDDCAVTHVPGMSRWAQEAVPQMPSAIVMARREYEAWFLAALESLRGKRGIRQDAAYEANPEQVRGAKGVVSRMMPQNAPYSETADQPALSAHFDLKAAYARASSFRKLVKELCRILEELGQTPIVPSDWSADNL